VSAGIMHRGPKGAGEWAMAATQARSVAWEHRQNTDSCAVPCAAPNTAADVVVTTASCRLLSRRPPL
jgi:hypothetical protein